MKKVDLYGSYLKQTARALGIRPDWLDTVIYIESGRNPRAVNPSSGATGLIQWMPETARDLGTSVTAIRDMSLQQQFSLIEIFLQDKAPRIRSLSDAYLAVFYPAAMAWPAGQTFPRRVYLQNQILDYNKDGKLSRADIERFVQKHYQSRYRKARMWPFVILAAAAALSAKYA